MSSILMTAVSVIAAGATFTCTPVRVWDGDGPIWCAEGPHVRVARIAARELDNSCRPGQPCPAASGVAARDALVEILGGARGVTRDGHIIVAGPRLSCRSDGWAKGNRTAAWCRLPDGRDLGEAAIATGTVVRWNYSPRRF